MSTNISDSSELAGSLASHLSATLDEAGKMIGSGGAKGALARGKIFLVARYTKNAVQAFQEALAHDPNADEAEARLVVTLVQLGMYERAISHATKLASRNPSFLLSETSSDSKASSYTLLGDAYASTGKIDQAKEAYSAAAEIAKEDNFAAGRLAQISLVLGEPKQAIRQKDAVADNPRFGDFAEVLSLGERNPALLPRLDAASFATMVQETMVGRPYIVDGSMRQASLDGNGAEWCDTATITRRDPE